MMDSEKEKEDFASAVIQSLDFLSTDQREMAEKDAMKTLEEIYSGGEIKSESLYKENGNNTIDQRVISKENKPEKTTIISDSEDEKTEEKKKQSKIARAGKDAKVFYSRKIKVSKTAFSSTEDESDEMMCSSRKKRKTVISSSEDENDDLMFNFGKKKQTVYSDTSMVKTPEIGESSKKKFHPIKPTSSVAKVHQNIDPDNSDDEKMDRKRIKDKYKKSQMYREIIQRAQHGSCNERTQIHLRPDVAVISKKENRSARCGNKDCQESIKIGNVTVVMIGMYSGLFKKVYFCPEVACCRKRYPLDQIAPPRKYVAACSMGKKVINQLRFEFPDVEVQDCSNSV